MEWIEEIASEYNLSENEKTAFVDYLHNAYEGIKPQPIGEAGSFKGWEGCIEYAKEHTGGEALNEFLLRNPVEFKDPSNIRIEIYPSFAGRIPVISFGDDSDFETFLVMKTYKGIAPSFIHDIGASFLSGKTLRLIVLSSKGYSNLTGAEVGLGEEEWRRLSYEIRREHECTHYYTRQVFGLVRNNLHDELIADFIGVYKATGEYKADWFLKFIGVLPGSGNRISAYTEGMTEAVREAVKAAAERTSRSLERWSQTEDCSRLSTGEQITLLCGLGLDGISKFA